MAEKRFQSFQEFYPFYLSEHSLPQNKLMHFIGSFTALLMLPILIVVNKSAFIPLLFVWGYLWAWVGHFMIEKNRPATFQYPIYSFMGDWVMFWEILKGQHRIFR